MISIKEVKTKREGKLFTEFPNKMYKNVEAFVPALSMDENNVFNKKKNPVFDYVNTVRFLAYKDNKLVGRIAGIVNHRLNYELSKKQVRFTRLDMIDDIEVTKALIKAVEDWAVNNFRMNEIIGPIGFTDMDRQGMLIDGFDQFNLFITIYNFPYYKEHMQILGFDKDVDWVEKRLTWPKVVPDKVKRANKILTERFGYRLHKAKTIKELKTFVYELFDVYNAAFTELYGFLAVPTNVIDFYVKQVVGILRLEWIWVVYDKNDKIAGFGIVMPSLGKANKKNNGKLFPFGFLRILKSLKKYDEIDFYFIAVAPEHQGRGIVALIFEDAINTGLKYGIKAAETGPELEENYAIQSFWKDFDYIEHKRRRCWIKPIK